MSSARSIYEDGGTDSLLDEGRDAFLYAQGKRSLNDDYGDEDQEHICKTIWMVPFRAQTYKYLAYNWILNFPFGIVSFSVFTTVVSLSAGLIALCCTGLFVFLFGLSISRQLGDADLALTNLVSPPNTERSFRPKPEEPDIDGIKAWAMTLLSSGQAWKDFFYLWLLKFPLALTTFVLTFALVIISLVSMFSIVIFYTCENCIENGNLCIGDQRYPDESGWSNTWQDGTCDGWHIHRIQDCVGLTFAGIPFFVLTLHLNNLLAIIQLKLSRWVLSDPDQKEAAQKLLGYDASAGAPLVKSSSATEEVRQKQKERKSQYGTNSKSTKSGSGSGSGYLDDFNS